jgi:hypothetical protein
MQPMDDEHLEIEFANASANGPMGIPRLTPASSSAAPVVEPHISDERIVPTVEDVFDRWIIGGIEAISKTQGVSLGFVLIACGLDYLSGFWKGGRAEQNDYKEFLKAHAEFDRYSPDDLYNSLRNGLVHNFTIHNGSFALIHNRPDLHLKMALSGQTILNFEDFFKDFKALKTAIFNKAKSDRDARDKFIKRFRDVGFVVLVDIPIN